jgi:hypothetical protein
MPKHAATRAPKPLSVRDRYRPPNRALSPGSIVNLRNEIRCKHLIHRLQSFALDDPDNPTSTRMTRTQAMVALSLLKKALPDMQTLEISGNQDQPITVSVLRFSDPLDVSLQTNGLQTGALQGSALTSDELLQPLTIDVEARLIEDDPQPISPGRTRGRKRNQ